MESKITQPDSQIAEIEHSKLYTLLHIWFWTRFLSIYCSTLQNTIAKREKVCILKKAIVLFLCVILFQLKTKKTTWKPSLGPIHGNLKIKEIFP